MTQGIAFQQTITASAVALPNNQIQKSVTLSALSTNTGIVYYGFSSTVTSTTGAALEKGTSVVLELSGGNTDQIYVVGTASDKLSVSGA